MTQSELLNYIIEKEKIKKEDLAKLFGIRKKNVEKVFNGKKTLTKRQVKNISVFTGIPQEAIKSGEVTLPDLQNTGVVFINEEFVKNQNTTRFESFIKTRLKGELAALFIIKLFTYFILMFGLIFSLITFYSAFIENIDKSTILIAFFTLVPFYLTFASIVPIFKITRKVNVNEKDRFKIFYLIIIASLIIFTVGTLIFNSFDWLYLILSLIPLAMALLTMLIEKKPAKKQKLIKDISTGIILAFFIVLAIAIEFIEGARESYFAVTYLAQFGALMSATIYYRDLETFEDFSKSFGMLSKKKVYKKKRVMSAFVSALLVTAIIAGGTHFGMLFVIKASIDNALNSSLNHYGFEQHSEYNKHDIAFTDEDETQTIDNGSFTYKIPVGLIDKTNKDKQSETFKSATYGNEEDTIMVVSLYNPTDESYPSIFSYDTGIFDSSEAAEDGLFDESKAIFRSKYRETIKNMLIEKYGFYPQNDYENRKLGGMINLEKINYWNKQEAFCHVPLLIMYSVTMPVYEETYFYETEGMQGIVAVRKTTNEETGKVNCVFSFDFNKRNAEWMDKMVSVRLPEEVASTDLAYKIINSVEIK